MREMLVVGNWKMNGSKATLDAFISELNPIDLGCQGIVCPPVAFLAQAQAGITNARLALGAQNLNAHKAGAYTGEVSADMLLEHGCKYVIVGHSERRAMFGETSRLVAAKFLAAADAGLIPILCIGETRTQRLNGEIEAVIHHQLSALVEAAGIQAFNLAVIAYEPLWAIGTGEAATPEQAEEAHRLIRSILGKYDLDLAESIPVLYGGSINATIAPDLFLMPNVDGALVGGASLKADAFAAICQAGFLV